jgi:hypothetical protein
MMKFCNLLILMFLPVTLMSQTLPKVFYIAGFKSTPNEIQSWKKQVQKNQIYNPHFSVEAFHLPSTQPSKEAVLKEGKKLVDLIVSEIDKSPSGSEFVLAGHSSGSALTNEIAKRVKTKSKIKLVVLDGFAPTEVPQQVEVTCWSAMNPNTGLKSMNTESMKSCSDYREIKSVNCRTQQCLHFSIINSAVPPGLSDLSRGYENLNPNLQWLDKFLPQKEKIESLPNR